MGFLSSELSFNLPPILTQLLCESRNNSQVRIQKVSLVLSTLDSLLLCASSRLLRNLTISPKPLRPLEQYETSPEQKNPEIETPNKRCFARKSAIVPRPKREIEMRRYHENLA